jgi:hypothetical protein
MSVSKRDQSGLKRFKMAQAEAGEVILKKAIEAANLTVLTLTRARFFWTVGVESGLNKG